MDSEWASAFCAPSRAALILSEISAILPRHSATLRFASSKSAVNERVCTVFSSSDILSSESCFFSRSISPEMRRASWEECSTFDFIISASLSDLVISSRFLKISARRASIAESLRRLCSLSDAIFSSVVLILFSSVEILSVTILWSFFALSRRVLFLSMSISHRLISFFFKTSRSSRYSFAFAACCFKGSS